ncbi:MAG: PleD family two-component system response regulator [Paracoccaceae bacterium]
MPANLRYLAIDDDPAFHLILTQMMVQLGYQAPVCATSAIEALDRLADPQAHFDGILLDIQMPGMDGIEACQRIRALPQHRETPIMMVTTLNGRAYVDRAFAVGATDYLTKPIDRLELQARLSMLDRFVRERTLSQSLRFAVEAMGDLPGVGFDFDDAVPLPKSDLLIDYLALQNHLLTLSRLKLHSHMAMAFQLVGASGLFYRLERMDYLDYMADVGSAISAALKRHSFLLAHAGGGEYICVLNRTQAIDSMEIEQDIASELMTYAASYDNLGLLMPAVRVGEPVHSGLFSPAAVKTMLSRARASVRSKVNAPYQMLAG